MMVFQTLPAQEYYRQGLPTDNPNSFSDKVALHFPVNSSRLLNDFSGNAEALRLLDKIWRDKRFYSTIDSIIIHGYASPEGDIYHNMRLSYERAQAIKDYIVQNHPYISSHKIYPKGQFVDFKAVEEIIDRESYMPYRSEAQRILRIKGISDQDRIILLHKVGGGEFIRHFARYYSGSLRSAIGLLFYKDNQLVSNEQLMKIIRDTVYVEVTKEELKIETLVVYMPSDTVYIDNYYYQAEEEVEELRKPIVAFKTNLFFDVLTALNFEFEFPISKRFSLLGEVITPWWLSEKKQYAFEVFNANVEGRVWFGPREHRPVISGGFLGIYAGAGYFDIEWGNKGYQGDFTVSTGITLGYAKVIGRKGNFRMEYSISGGYFKTSYSEYEPRFGSDDKWHLISQKDGNFSWIGPSKVKISLAWMPKFKFNNNK
ncbi:MAG: DUF3575 domain-containing protein [Marinilabiliaceae bacterium]|nr:DUF3575 domain-containing protein [Marinilabiliaceae bacterium]